MKVKQTTSTARPAHLHSIGVVQEGPFRRHEVSREYREGSCSSRSAGGALQTAEHASRGQTESRVQLQGAVRAARLCALTAKACHRNAMAGLRVRGVQMQRGCRVGPGKGVCRGSLRCRLLQNDRHNS